MAWVKIPKEHHELFYARLPHDKRVKTLKMFGAVAAKVNGHLFGSLFARSFLVRLSPEDHAEAVLLDGVEPFDPMGNGRVMTSTLLMPEALMDEPEEMKGWLARAFTYTASLPPKAAKAAKKPAAKKPAAKKPAAKKPTAKKPAAKKPAAKKPTAKKRSR